MKGKVQSLNQFIVYKQLHSVQASDLKYAANINQILQTQSHWYFIIFWFLTIDEQSTNTNTKNPFPTEFGTRVHLL